MNGHRATRHCRIDSATAMEALGAALARTLPRGLRIHLEGDLAAGKTTLARGYITALGHVGAVKSPTYTLVESYELGVLTVHHFDLYRLAQPGELAYIGLEQYLDGNADVLVEWPARGGDWLPAPDLTVTLSVAGDAREVDLSAAYAAAEVALDDLINTLNSAS